MRIISSLRKASEETWQDYFSRLSYAILRRIIPQYREQYRLETLVGPKNCWNELQQYQFNLLTQLGLTPHHTLLDIGCGPLTVGLKLIPYLEAGNYVGLDVRPAPLIEGYKLIAKGSLVHKNPTLLLSDSFGKGSIPGRRFDYIWMSQLSCHLTDAQMRDLFEQANARMTPDAVLLFDIMDPAIAVPNDASWSGFSFHIRPFAFYADLARQFSLATEIRGRLENYGYPKRINLRNNLVLEFRKTSPA
jgi:SAM-dependent methyltransferase